MPSGTHIATLIGLAFFFWFATLAIRGIPLSWDFITPFGIVVSTVTAVVVAFNRWFWQWPIFRGWLVNRPYLQGTWAATIISNYREGKPYEGFVVIRQTYFHFSFRVMTENSRSETLSANFHTLGDGTYDLSMVYRNFPNADAKHGSPIHHGAAIFHVGSGSAERLDGTYWTERETYGRLVLTNRRQELCADFVEASQLSQRAAEP